VFFVLKFTKNIAKYQHWRNFAQNNTIVLKRYFFRSPKLHFSKGSVDICTNEKTVFQKIIFSFTYTVTFTAFIPKKSLNFYGIILFTKNNPKGVKCL